MGLSANISLQGRRLHLHTLHPLKGNERWLEGPSDGAGRGWGNRQLEWTQAEEFFLQELTGVMADQFV